MDSVKFSRRGEAFQNRNRIKTEKGPVWLTIPVLHQEMQRICDVQIDNKQDWSRKHWYSILHAYTKSPYFDSYKDFFQNIYSKNWDKLVDLNESIIRYLLKEFKVSVEIVKVSELQLDAHGTDLIVGICKALGADTYLSGKNGIRYIDISKANDAGISVRFQEFRHPVYTQQHEHLGFMPKLSCIDLLFNCGENSMKIIRDANMHMDPS